MKYDKAYAGNFYAVGVGPGAPDLLTLRAINVISSADVVIAPRSRIASKSLAREIIANHLNDKQEVIEHIYPMERDAEKTYASWSKIADLVDDRCHKGLSVVQVTIGDPLIYSTSCYLLDGLRSRMEEGKIHIIPGITAFQATASIFNQTMCLQEDRLLLMPATDINAVKEGLRNCETLVLYKCGKKIRELAELLKQEGLSERAVLACNAEQEDRQFLTRNLLEAADGEQGYLATVIIRVDNKEWNQ